MSDSSPSSPLDYVAANAQWWDGRHDEEVALSRRAWAAEEPTWGIFGVPESDVGMLSSVAAGMTVAELGCGTGYVSAWLARRGAHPVGIDPSASQLQIVRARQTEFQLEFPLVRAAGEQVPLRSGVFDFVISEYGAAIWADPYRWIAEAARLLRPDGELAFLGNSTLMMTCAPDDDGVPATDRLVRDHFGMYRFTWPDDPTVEFHLGHGDWIRLLRANGFEVEDLIELRAPEGATSSYDFVTADWAQRWPCEEVWRARLR